jgi:hypothetical protein
MPNVETIDEKAFMRCESLASVEMPKVQKIGERAFYYCKYLKSVDINPNAEIGWRAFYGTPIEQDIKEQFGLTERFNHHSKSRRKPMRESKRYSDVIPYNKRKYWYFTTHGVQLGSIPKDLNILEIREGRNRKGTWGTFVCLDGVLSTDELRYYDMIELVPTDI